MNDPESCDLLILGGGLSGLTLALQVLRARPETSVIVLEKASWPPPVAAHKVGESTVELGTYYLREVLGLAEYLDAEHLPKLGLRFFFKTTPGASLSERPEFGAVGELPVPSHQLDRGMLEAELAERVQAAGGGFWSSCRVGQVDLHRDGHTTQVKTPSGRREVRSRWVVDATGRASTLKRQQKALQDSPHDSNAVWFRVAAEIDIEQWDDDPSFLARMPRGVRHLSTNHLMGDGYWVWFIPLSSGSTSVGIVSDPTRHALKSMASFDSAMQWLGEHEPQAAAALDPLRDQVQDFLALRKYSHGAERVFHPLRWALTGDAGVFLDPFYSPGTDFIALSNTYITDLVARDLAGERVRSRINEYNRTYLQMFEAWVPIYERMYETFGVGQVVALKVVWDFSTYWSFQVPAFVNSGFLDVGFMTRTRALWQGITELNRTMQERLLRWARVEPNPTSLQAAFVDPMELGFLREFQAQMVDSIPLADLEQRLAGNLAVLEAVAAEIERRLDERMHGVTASIANEAIAADIARCWFADDEVAVAGRLAGPQDSESPCPSSLP